MKSIDLQFGLNRIKDILAYPENRRVLTGEEEGKIYEPELEAGNGGEGKEKEEETDEELGF